MVFDADGRTQRRELRRLTSILWDSVSDVIVISVRHADRRRPCSILPSKPWWWRSPAPVGQPPSSVLIIESIGNNETDATPSAAYFTDSVACCTGTPPPMACIRISDSNIDNRVNLPLDSHLAKEAWGIFSVAWESRSDSTNTSAHCPPMHQVDGEDLSCELKCRRAWTMHVLWSSVM
jgi:hypothetical protein